MSETTTSTTDEQSDENVEQLTEAAPEPAAAEPQSDSSASDEEKPKRTLGLRKPPSGPARGAMAALTMAAVPATGVVGSVVYGNFGAAGLAATAATGLAAGGVALAVRARRRAEERARAKGDKPGLPPHELGGLKKLLGGAKEKAAARRAAMAERRAGRGGTAGGMGAGRRLGGGSGSVGGRVRQALGGGGRGRSAGVGSTAGAGGSRRVARGTGAASRSPQSGGRAGASRAGTGGGRSAAGGRGAAGRPLGGGPRSSGGGSRSTGGPRNVGSSRYTNPSTGRPMTPRQVSSAIRQQQRAQRVVSGNSYPRQAARWIRQHPKVAGWAVAGLGGAAATVMAAPLLAAAGVGLGIYGVARHPAFRNVALIGARRAVRHTARFGRWLRGQWLAWRRRNTPEEPLDGEIVDEPTAVPPEPDIVDAEVVPDPEPSTGSQPELTPTPRPESAPPANSEPFAPPRRQPRLITTGNTSTENEENITMSQPFETACEALHDVSFTPESGMHAEAAVDAIPGLLSAAEGSIRSVLSSIAEHLPQAADSLGHLEGIADALSGLETQASEQIAEWKSSANWVWQGQD